MKTFVANDKIQKFGKPVPTILSLTVSQHVNNFSDEVNGDNNKCDLLVFYSEIC